MNGRLQLNSTLACVLAAGVALAAQGQGRGQQPGATPPTPPTSQSTPSTPQSASADSSRELTVTGCLMSDTSPAGGTSTPGSGPAVFKLTRAELSPTEGDRAGARAGASASSNSRGTTSEPIEYRLMAATGVNLSSHLNQRVRITATRSELGVGAGTRGSTETPAGNPAGRAGQNQPSSGARATGQAARDAAAAPMLRVTSVTMLGSTCQ